MLRLKDWFLLVVVPFSFSLALDQYTKLLAQSVILAKTYGPFLIAVSRNSGVMLGGLDQWPSLYRVTALASFGALLIYAFFVAQYLIPIKSRTFRVGLSIFGGSITGNLIDRILYGHVIDFIQFSSKGITSGVFNLADALQWVGVGAVMLALIRKGQILWPANERRGRKWINPEFQWRYCLTYLGVGSAGVLICGALFYAFLKATLAETRPGDFFANLNTLRAFSAIFLMIGLIYAISSFLVARSLSHRIAGPIFAFENFLEKLINGEQAHLKLRDSDEFSNLEEIASKFRSQFHEKLGITVAPLTPGAKAPELSARTFQKNTVNLRDYRGKKVWLCFYRYATCPLCAVHFGQINKRLDELEKNDIQVIVVYESSEDTFLDPKSGETYDLIRTSRVPLIADPDLKLYRLYRSQRSKWKALKLISVIRGLLHAKAAGFKQSKITGSLWRIPAHVLIDRDGKVYQAYYGKSLTDHIPWATIEKFMKS